MFILNAYLQTMTKTPVKFQNDRYKTVGGVAYMRYPSIVRKGWKVNLRQWSGTDAIEIKFKAMIRNRYILRHNRERNTTTKEDMKYNTSGDPTT